MLDIGLYINISAQAVEHIAGIYHAEVVLLFSRCYASLIVLFRTKFPIFLAVDSFFGGGVFVESLLCI